MNQAIEHKNRRLIFKLIGVVIGMFAFAVFIMPPLYDAFCDLTGLNGKMELTRSEAPVVSKSQAASSSDDSSASDQSATVDETANAADTIKVQLTTKIDKSIPWTLEPEIKGLKVVRGKMSQVDFKAVNLANIGITGRAIPSVSPAQATAYLRKMECFCFQEQYLGPNESKIMPMQFYFTDDLPESIKEITLSYTVYNMEKEDGSSSD